MTDVTIPSPGESITEVRIGAWKRNDGDWVEKDELLNEIESDKATLELLAPAAGTLKVTADSGSDQKVGAIVAKIDDKAKRPAGAAPAAKPAPTAAPAAEAIEPKATSVARKMAADKGVDIAKVEGTGPGGRVTKADIENAGSAPAAKPAAKPAPAKPVAKKLPEPKAPAKSAEKAPKPPEKTAKAPEKAVKATDVKAKAAEKPVAEPPAAAKGKKGAKAEKRRIDTPEIQEKIRELIKLAKEQEYLTYDDINEILPNDLVDPDDVEAIMERLRNMEFDIIDASEVDRFKDKKKDEGDGDEEDVKADQKLDILDDPVRMYLKQMGQVPLLTREQEVEISKRIEDAEIEVSKNLHQFGFITDLYLDLADKLNKGKERFDRVILDKKIESRERYMKGLPKLCDQLKQLHEENDNIFRQLSAKAPRGKKKLEETFAKNIATMHRIYVRFYYKQKIVEDFCEQVEDYIDKFRKYARRLQTHPDDKEFVSKMREIQQRTWLNDTT